MKAAWYQKWQIHLRLRPEEFGGLVHKHLTGMASYPVTLIFSSSALPEVFNRYGTFLLPMAYSEGCPTHPAYPAGHAGRIVAGADSIDLAGGIVSPGTYTSVTVDEYGRVTAGSNPAASGKYAADIGDGSTTDIVVTHNLGTRDVIVRVRKTASPYDYWEVDTEATTVNTVTLRFTVAPANGEFRVIITG